MKQEIDLLKYEAPAISEYVNGYLGTLVARYLAWKINKKIRRYNKRIEREKFILSITSKTK